MTEMMPETTSPRRMASAARKRRRMAVVRRVVLGVVFVLVVSFAAFLGYTHMSLLDAFTTLIGHGGEVFDTTPAFSGMSRVNILLLGTDVNFVDKGIPRSDTIKLVTVDLKKRSVSMLSIPRDTWVEIPGHGHSRINSAYQSGGENELNRVRAAQGVVSDLLTELYGQPIHIDRYVRIQTGGFKNIVDAMGGVTVDVEKKMDYDDNYQNLYIHLKPGPQKLNGREAMGYVRFRHDKEGDYGRMRRQDQFIRAMMAQINTPEGQKNLPHLLGPILSMMKTDLTLKELRTLKTIGTSVGMDGIFSTRLPTTSDRKGRAMVEVVTDTVEAARVIGEVFNGPLPTVAVINGSEKRRFVRDACARIDEDDFRVVANGTLKEPVEQSRIITVPKYEDKARALAAQFGIETVSTDGVAPEAEYNDEKPPHAKITFVIGVDYPHLNADAQHAGL